MKKKTVPLPPLSYVISVSLGTGCYRHIRVGADDTLDMLSDEILDAFDFCNDHLHAFFMDNRAWSSNPEACFWMDPDDDMMENVNPGTDEVTLRELDLPVGHKFKFVFDFGDDWEFSCRVLKKLEEDTEFPKVLRSVGKAPEQYPDWEDE